MRTASPDDLGLEGFRVEDFEERRASGETAFLDVTGDESDVEVQPSDSLKELWGSFYAAGHFEFDGSINGALLDQVVIESFARQGFKAPGVMRGEHAGGVISALISDRGIRLDTGGVKLIRSAA